MYLNQQSMKNLSNFWFKPSYSSTEEGEDKVIYSLKGCRFVIRHTIFVKKFVRLTHVRWLQKFCYFLKPFISGPHLKLNFSNFYSCFLAFLYMFLSFPNLLQLFLLFIYVCSSAALLFWVMVAGRMVVSDKLPCTQCNELARVPANRVHALSTQNIPFYTFRNCS